MSQHTTTAIIGRHTQRFAKRAFSDKKHFLTVFEQDLTKPTEKAFFDHSICIKCDKKIAKAVHKFCNHCGTNREPEGKPKLLSTETFPIKVSISSMMGEPVNNRLTCLQIKRIKKRVHIELFEPGYFGLPWLTRSIIQYKHISKSIINFHLTAVLEKVNPIASVEFLYQNSSQNIIDSLRELMELSNLEELTSMVETISEKKKVYSTHFRMEETKKKNE